MKKAEQIVVRITPAQRIQLEIYASEHDITLGKLIRNIIDAWAKAKTKRK